MGGRFLKAAGFRLLAILLSPAVAAANFVAYNDLSGEGAGSSSGNVTNISFSNTTGTGSGQLIDFDTGNGTGVTLQVTRFANAFRDSGFSVPDYVGDAAAEFGTILNNNGYIRHDLAGQGYVELFFTGLDSARRYTMVITGDRRGGSSYLPRTTRFSISGVESFVHASSEGIPYTGSNWVEFSTGQNDAGYVARFADINPGPDGNMLITAGVGPNGDGRWYVNTLKLVETGPGNAILFAPGQIDSVVGSANVNATLSIPPGSNESSDVQVILESDQPGVAAPVGVCCSPLVLTFPMGGPNEQSIAFEIGAAGTATITTTNDSDLIDAALTVTVAAGQVTFVPAAVNGRALGTVPVAVGITPGSNDTRPVAVTVSSDDPTIAAPEGAISGSIVLDFPAGAPSQQTVNIELGPAGTTALRTTNDGGLGDAVLPIVVTGSGAASFVAYNDVVYSGGSGHPALMANVTTFNTGNGSPGPASGVLIDKTTGASTGVTVTMTQSGGATWQPSATTGGNDCIPGTDARSIFDPDSTVSLMGTIHYGSAGWWVDVLLTGLDPTRTYEFVTTANRDEPGFAARITRYTISGAESFLNASTPGTVIADGGASTSFSTGDNTQNGYVARWVDINPGPDGSFKVRAEAGTSEYRAYAFDAFMLVENALTDTVHIAPWNIDSVVGGADVDVILSIPAGSNASRDVQVMLLSDNPAVAEPQGASGGPFLVTFWEAGPARQTVPIRIGTAGNASITTTNDADLTDAVLTVAVDAGQIEFIPDTLHAFTSSLAPLTIALSPGSNDTRAVAVTVSTDDAAIAAPEGAAGGSLALSFAAGASHEQTINLEIGEAGVTAIRTTNDGGLADAVLPVQVTHLDWIQVVVDPYAGVNWETFQQHKANMHTHTTQSDGNLTPAQTIDEYHARGYTILALTDHNHNTWPWQAYGREPDLLGMLAISGNEPSDHHHVNSLFIEFQTTSTNLELTLTQIGNAGGLSVINHPGRYNLTVQDYVNLFNTFDHSYGLEVINQAGRYNGNWSPVWPGNDIHLWDLILSIMMPDRPVWGLATDDMHTIGHLGRDWLMYLVPPSQESSAGEQTGRPWAASFFSTGPDEAFIRQASERGQYYFSSVGPRAAGSRDVNQTPVIDSITVDQVSGTITISATSGGQPLPASDYRWISMAEQVYTGPTINFRTTPGVGSYVRAEMIGQGGTTYTNPFGIANLGPVLEISPEEIARSVHLGQSLSDQSFTVANSGLGTLTYTIAWDAPWLSIAPIAGELSDEADSITLSFDVGGLPVGQHPALITVTSPEASGSPQTLPVVVTVTTVGPDFDHDGDVDQEDFGLLQRCFSGTGVAQLDPQCAPARLDDDEDVDDGDLAIFFACVSGANIPADPDCESPP